MTAALSRIAIAQVAPWAAESGFQTLEIACWPEGGAERRYGGVSHIDVANLDKQGAKAHARTDELAAISTSPSLAYYPNILDPDPAASGRAIEHLKKVIDAAVLA